MIYEIVGTYELKKYSDDQPRDEQGRFGSGGEVAGSPSSTVSTPTFDSGRTSSRVPGGVIREGDIVHHAASGATGRVAGFQSTYSYRPGESPGRHGPGERAVVNVKWDNGTTSGHHAEELQKP